MTSRFPSAFVPTPLITQSVGSAERAMRALLERILRELNLSFPEWTALVFVNASLLTREQITQRQIDGRIATNADESQRAIDSLVAAGRAISNQGGMLQIADRGSNVFTEVSGKIGNITHTLYGDLPEQDLETTHRTLLEIAERANRLLATPMR